MAAGSSMLGLAIADATAEPTVRGRARTPTRPVVEEQTEARRILKAPAGERAEKLAHQYGEADVPPNGLRRHPREIGLPLKLFFYIAIITVSPANDSS